MENFAFLSKLRGAFIQIVLNKSLFLTPVSSYINGHSSSQLIVLSHAELDTTLWHVCAIFIVQSRFLCSVNKTGLNDDTFYHMNVFHIVSMLVDIYNSSKKTFNWGAVKKLFTSRSNDPVETTSCFGVGLWFNSD